MKSRVLDAIANGSLWAKFQPIVALQSAEVIGFEALIRGPWQSDAESPLSLFKLAEEEGVERELEAAAMVTCVRTFGLLGAQRDLFVNVSALNFEHVLFCDEVQEAVGAWGAAGCGKIVIELTEKKAASNVSRLNSAVEAARRLGFRIALDDFGVAHSNLNWWIALRPEFVKLDALFVNGVSSDPLKREILELLQRLARSTNTKLLAEGIEWREDLELCRDLHIPFAQGYFINRPSTQLQHDLSYAAATVLTRSSIF